MTFSVFRNMLSGAATLAEGYYNEIFSIMYALSTKIQVPFI